MIGAAAYVWIKALHVASIIAFIAGLVAQALFIVAAARTHIAVDVTSKFRAAERRLTVPAILIALATGVTIATAGGWFSSAWLMIKLALVVLLLALHGYQSGLLRRMESARDVRTGSMQLLAPAIVMVFVTAIALLAVTKPTLQ